MGDDRGSLVALEAYKTIPFDIKRVYYIFGTQSGVSRGFHAHRALQQVAVCVTGIRHAYGEYVAFLDGDDLWLPNKLSDQIDFMFSTKSNFAYTKYRVMNSQGTDASCPMSVYREYGCWSALALRGIATATVMAKRSLFSEEILNTYDLSHGEDYLWWLMILRRGTKARGLMRPLALYRDVESSLSKRRWKHQRSVWRTYRVELGVPAPIAAFAYTIYVLDVAVRRLRCLLCTKITGSVQVREVLT